MRSVLRSRTVRLVEAAQHAGVVEQLRTGEPVEEAQPVGQHAGRALGGARVGPRVDVVDAHGARVGAEQAGDHRQRRGLARAVRPDDAEERAGAHVERDAVDGGVVAELLHEALDREHRGASGAGAGRATRSVRFLRGAGLRGAGITTTAWSAVAQRGCLGGDDRGLDVGCRGAGRLGRDDGQHERRAGVVVGVGGCRVDRRIGIRDAGLGELGPGDLDACGVGQGLVERDLIVGGRDRCGRVGLDDRLDGHDLGAIVVGGDGGRLGAPRPRRRWRMRPRARRRPRCPHATRSTGAPRWRRRRWRPQRPPRPRVPPRCARGAPAWSRRPRVPSAVVAAGRRLGRRGRLGRRRLGGRRLAARPLRRRGLGGEGCRDALRLPLGGRRGGRPASCGGRAGCRASSARPWRTSRPRRARWTPSTTPHARRPCASTAPSPRAGRAWRTWRAWRGGSRGGGRGLRCSAARCSGLACGLGGGRGIRRVGFATGGLRRAARLRRRGRGAGRLRGRGLRGPRPRRTRLRRRPSALPRHPRECSMPARERCSRALRGAPRRARRGRRPPNGRHPRAGAFGSFVVKV